ncbi:MAG: hypothetical protein RJB38_2457 [Pseudomonadota bacterium]
MAGVVSEARRLGYRVIVDHDRMPSAQVLRDASTHWSHWVRLPEAWRDLYYERRRCERAHAVVTSSPLYAARARKLAPETPVYVIGPSVQWQQFQDDREPCGSSLSFCGDLEDPAQVQGVRWFAEEVLPRLRAALKEKAPPVLVAGPEASPVLLDFLKHHAISALTWKKHDALAARENTLKCLKQSMIAFIPLQQKTSGAQFLLNAMAMRRPVVTTSKGAEGLQLNPGREIWLGDQPDTFTSALIRLIREPELRAETSRHAHLRLTEDFDLEKTRRTLQGLLHQL